MKRKCRDCQALLIVKGNWLQGSFNKGDYICSFCKRNKAKIWRENNKDKINKYYLNYKKQQRALEFIYYHTKPEYKLNRGIYQKKYNTTQKGQKAVKLAKAKFDKKNKKYLSLYYKTYRVYGFLIPIAEIRKNYEQIKQKLENDKRI